MTKKKAPEELQKPGRKSLYGEETVVVPTKVPKSKVKQFKKEVKEKVLKQWEVKK